MNKKSILLLVMSIVVFTFGSTYAWFTWASRDNTVVTAQIGNIGEVRFDEGDDLTVETMGPILDYNEGEALIYSVLNRTEAVLSTNVYFDITALPVELRVSSFKWVLVESADNINYTMISEGDFSTNTVGDTITVISANELNPARTYYKFIVYIDGTDENNINMQGKTFSGTLRVTADGV